MIDKIWACLKITKCINKVEQGPIDRVQGIKNISTPKKIHDFLLYRAYLVYSLCLKGFFFSLSRNPQCTKYSLSQDSKSLSKSNQKLIVHVCEAGDYLDLRRRRNVCVYLLQKKEVKGGFQQLFNQLFGGGQQNISKEATAQTLVVVRR